MAGSRNTALAATAPAANTFHSFAFDAHAVQRLQQELLAFSSLISAAKAPDGVGEEALLAWFGASVDRMALLVICAHNIVPTHVARELQIGRFRADFGWACIDTMADPVVGMIELEPCERDTLFQKRQRSTPYLGERFLGGFAQLVDWCAFGYADACEDPAISSLIGPAYDRTAYVYALVAGDRRFASDGLSKRRLDWWADHIKLGRGTQMKSFDQLIAEGQRHLLNFVKAR